MLPKFFWKKREKNNDLGARGEDLAVEFLKRGGYKILERNFFNPDGRRMGEIDIIAEKEGELFFLEVKTRKGSMSDSIVPEEQITSQKLRKLQKIADYYVRTNNYWKKSSHFDALTVLIDPSSEKAEITHLKDIFF